MDLNVGNIISQRGINYLIIDKGGLDLLCIPVNNIDLRKPLQFGDFKKLDFKNATIINSRKPSRYITKATDNIILYLLKKYKEYLKALDDKDKIQRGSIISKDNKFYYVYSEEGQNWMTFEVINEKIPTYHKIETFYSDFYTNFADVKISKIDNFKILFLCTQTEIENISEYRKRCKKEDIKQKNALEQKNKYKHKVGDIIIDKGESYCKRYIIIKNCPNTYECIEINDIKKAKFDPVLIKKKYARFCTNTSLKGIKWFEINNDFDMKNIGNKEYLHAIFKTQYEYLKKLEENNLINNNKNIINIGSIVIKEDKYYYIFSEEGQNWIVFELNKRGIINGDVFTLGDEVYYTNYNQTVINKNDIFDSVYTCREGQIELLRRRRKAYQKIIFQNAIKADESIVKIDELSDEEYTVKNNLGSTLICTSNYDLDHNDKRRHYFNSEDVVFIKVKQKRK